ncbi:DUF6086 family protein [Streptomyces sp. NPDC054865]
MLTFTPGRAGARVFATASEPMSCNWRSISGTTAGSFEAELDLPSGIGSLANDECRITPEILEIFVNALLARTGVVRPDVRPRASARPRGRDGRRTQAP